MYVRPVEARARQRSNFPPPENQLDNPRSFIGGIAFAGLLRCILGSHRHTSQQTDIRMRRFTIDLSQRQNRGAFIERPRDLVAK